jgi:hypothetical protein
MLTRVALPRDWRSRDPFRFIPALLLSLLLLSLLCGCATQKSVATRPFSFGADTFAFANELLWSYDYDSAGNWKTEKRQPKPDYAQRCFVLARSTQQFFRHACFDLSREKLHPSEYRQIIQQVVSRNPRISSAPGRKVVIPGFADLRDFSKEFEQVLKQECGGRWQSYFQRGHWRMIFPFTRPHQAKTAENLFTTIPKYSTTVLHLVRFPQLTINHAVLVYQAEETELGFEFLVYDPNTPEGPAKLRYDKVTRTFTFPPNDYFRGGRVDVYEVYHHWAY